MILEESPWLYPTWYEGYEEQNARYPLSFCTLGVHMLFEIPDDVKRIRFFVHNRAGKERILFKIRKDHYWCIHDPVYAFVCLEKKVEDMDLPHSANRYARKLLEYDVSLYLECEYEE